MKRLNPVMKATYTSRAVMTPYGKFFPPVTIEEAIAQQKRNNAEIGLKDSPYMGKSYSEIKKMENLTMEESTKSAKRMNKASLELIDSLNKKRGVETPLSQSQLQSLWDKQDRQMMLVKAAEEKYRR